MRYDSDAVSRLLTHFKHRLNANGPWGMLIVACVLISGFCAWTLMGPSSTFRLADEFDDGDVSGSILGFDDAGSVIQRLVANIELIQEEAIEAKQTSDLISRKRDDDGTSDTEGEDKPVDSTDTDEDTGGGGSPSEDDTGGGSSDTSTGGGASQGNTDTSKIPLPTVKPDNHVEVQIPAPVKPVGSVDVNVGPGGSVSVDTGLGQVAVKPVQETVQPALDSVRPLADVATTPVQDAVGIADKTQTALVSPD